MLSAFRAILRGNFLEWGKEVDCLLKPDRPVQVLVTILEDEPSIKAQGRGQQMAAVLEKLAQTQAFAETDPMVRQREVRQDRELPGLRD